MMVRCAGETGAALPAPGRLHGVGAHTHRHTRQREERSGKTDKVKGGSAPKRAR